MYERTFSKTRIFYYDNEPSRLQIGNMSSYTIERAQSNSSYPYLTVSVQGSGDTGHNWSYVPINSYGIFCTFGEIQSLVENCDSFEPISIDMVLGHTIPLARYPSTANSTQLSFNNTIYSLIACEDTNYISVNTHVLDSEIENFARTFDGVAANDGVSRNVLPKRNMFFRIPYHSLLETGAATATNQVITIPIASNATTAVPVVDANRWEVGQTISQLIDSYLPELLQNNDKVYTLYPGENQYQKTWGGFKSEYCALDCTGPSFNETIWQLDQRLATLVNRDITGRTANNILALPIVFQMKGNNADAIPDMFKTNNTTVDQVNLQFNKFADLYFNRDGRNDYNTNLDKVFIKGIPIVDDSNSLVPHQFCCTITWTLTIKCTPRSDMTVNKLQWRMTYPYLQQFQNANGTLTSVLAHKGNFAKKPWRHNIFKRTPMMRYTNIPLDSIKTYDKALKNRFKHTASTITFSSSTSPDDIAPSQFGYTLPYGAGWYEGHSLLVADTIPTT